MEDSQLDNILERFELSSSPIIFGPPTWKYLHLWTMRYPLHASHEEQETAASFIQEVFRRLGCLNCTHHAFQYAKENPVPLDSRIEIVWYFWEFHNAVNKRLQKPQFTKQEFFQMYLMDSVKKLQPKTTTAATIFHNLYNKHIKGSFTTEESANNSTTPAVLFGFILLCILIVMVWVYRRRRRRGAQSQNS